MGLSVDNDRLEKLRKLREARGFRPLELTEGNVNAIYRRCLPKEETDPQNIIKYFMFFKQMGFKEDANPFYFDAIQLQKNRENIAYLLGQLYDIHHTRDGLIYLKNFSLNYNDKVWLDTDNVDEARAVIFNLIALGSTAKNEKGFSYIGALRKAQQACDDITVEPTFSPKDPKFVEWSQSEKGKALLLKFQKTCGDSKQ